MWREGKGGVFRSGGVEEEWSVYCRRCKIWKSGIREVIEWVLSYG